MIENILWIAVVFMLFGSIIPKKMKTRRLLSAIWDGDFFSIHWFYQPIHYIEIGDYFNVALVITVGAVCLIIAHTMVKEYHNNETSLKPDITSMATSATALGSLFYFPFAQMDVLNVWIISQGNR